MLAAEIWWDPIANFSAAKFRMRNRGHLLLSRPRKNRLSWFSFFISANQLRSVLLSVVSGGGFQPGCIFFLFSASRFLAAHKKLHSFKPSKRQMAQCPAAMAPLRQPSVAGVALGPEPVCFCSITTMTRVSRSVSHCLPLRTQCCRLWALLDSSWPPNTAPPAESRTVWTRWVADCTGRQSWFARQQGAQRIHDDRLVALVGVFSLAEPYQTEASDTATLIESVPHGWWYTASLPGGKRVVVYLT